MVAVRIQVQAKPVHFRWLLRPNHFHARVVALARILKNGINQIAAWRNARNSGNRTLRKLVVKRRKKTALVPTFFVPKLHIVRKLRSERRVAHLYYFGIVVLRKNPNVCFEVDIMTDMANWKSVIVQGTFEELKDGEAKEAHEILFGRVFSLLTSSTIHAHEHEITGGKIDDSNRIKQLMYRIKIKEVTGRFERK